MQDRKGEKFVWIGGWLGGFNMTAMKWYSFFWVLPCFIPFVTAGKRNWNNKT
jgi:hypothetical protein